MVLEDRPYGCLAGAFTLHLTHGCDIGCRVCHLRGYDLAPPPAAEPLEQALDRLAEAWEQVPRGRRDPAHALVNIHADAFQPEPKLEDLTFRALRWLLERRIGVSFVTKGAVTRRMLELFAANRGRVRGRVILTTLDPALSADLEPLGVPPEDRLEVIGALAALDALVDVRIDPLLPGLNDTDEQLEALVAALAERRVPHLTASYVHLRPGILADLVARLGPAAGRALEESYRAQPWTEVGLATKVKLLPRNEREAGYLRLKRIATRHGIELGICQCKNPDLSGDPCGAMEGRRFPQPARHGPGDRTRTLIAC